ncbi:hypothetical protein B6S41_00910 [Enterococcus faecalis]|nr:hypothetical protein B6S39_01270 [Enterococcus faecalis]OSM29025.1 hypothetical protein B6S41_00910 [Enterococcus faecalis]
MFSYGLTENEAFSCEKYFNQLCKINTNANRQDDNLKNSTLGIWVISESEVQPIKYIIGVHTGADNAVVSA